MQEKASTSLTSSLQLLPFLPGGRPDTKQPRLGSVCGTGLCTGAEGKGSVPPPRTDGCSAPGGCTHGAPGQQARPALQAASFPSACQPGRPGSAARWQSGLPRWSGRSRLLAVHDLCAQARKSQPSGTCQAPGLKILKENNPPVSLRPKQFWAGFRTNTGSCVLSVLGRHLAQRSLPPRGLAQP